MIIAISSYRIISIEHPEKRTNDLAVSGFEHISLDLNIGCFESELENLGKEEKLREKIRESSFAEKPSKMTECFSEMIEQCKQRCLDVSIARAPYLRRDTKRTDLNQYLLEIMEESIRFCSEIDCQYLVVPPLFAGVKKEEEWQINHDYYMRLGKTARESNVMILLENQCADYNGHLIRGICSDGSSAAEWVDMLNQESGEERFGFCMDVGVCTLCGQNMYELVLQLNNRIKAVVIRDCDGNSENALLPFTCAYHGQSQTDWLNLIRGLRKIGFDGQLIFDFADTAVAFSPLLRPQLFSFAKSVADYIKWQIEIENLLRKYKHIVLFGAGNMCRNYMKCYGEKFPPLFTCDNNSKNWGTAFCGLEVKSPECLRDIPEDCAVFICNIYYREIEEQLREMGITNPIEYFNDEYMPSFYFDRLKMS